jgi:hypothetical protein
LRFRSQIEFSGTTVASLIAVDCAEGVRTNATSRKTAAASVKAIERVSE